MNYSLALIPLFLLALAANGQQAGNPKPNSLSFEIGKNGLIYNLVYDRQLKANRFGLRAGAGYNFAHYLSAFTVGGGVYYLAGKTKHFLELGAELQYLVVDEVSDDQKGFSFVYPARSVKAAYPSLNIGYRHYGAKTVFRIGFSPGVIDGGFVAGAYAGFGFRF